MHKAGLDLYSCGMWWSHENLCFQTWGCPHIWLPCSRVEDSCWPQEAAQETLASVSLRTHVSCTRKGGNNCFISKTPSNPQVLPRACQSNRWRYNPKREEMYYVLITRCTVWCPHLSAETKILEKLHPGRSFSVVENTVYIWSKGKYTEKPYLPKHPCTCRCSTSCLTIVPIFFYFFY